MFTSTITKNISRIYFITLLVLFFLLFLQCSSLGIARTRNEYSILISTGSLPQEKYTPLGVLTLETAPSFHLLGIFPPSSLQDEMLKLEKDIRDDLLMEVMEMGGNAIINLKYEKQQGGFVLLIPFWTTDSFKVTGEVIKIHPKERTIQDKLTKMRRKNENAKQE